MDPSSAQSQILLIDESDDVVHDGTSYVVACAITIAADVNAVTARLNAAIQLNPGRSRPFHWADEGTDVRTEMLSVVAAVTIAAVAVVGTIDAGIRQEQVRYDCLRRLFLHASAEATELIIESRERANRNTGQNRTDHRAIVDARHAHEIPPLMRYRWAGKEEPLLWAPDAVAGMALATLRHDPRWLASFEQAGGTLQIIHSAP